MLKKTILTIVLVVSGLNVAQANPYYQASEVCPHNFVHDDQQEIAVFMQNGMNVAINAANGNPNNTISDVDLRASIHSTLEMWNLQSNAPQFIFKGSPASMAVLEGGDTAFTNPLCTQMPERSVFIQFRDKCATHATDCAGNSSENSSCTNQNIIASVGATCKKEIFTVTFWGRQMNNSSAWSWAFRPDAGGQDFVAILLHELGHVLGLGHYDGDTHAWGVMGPTPVYGVQISGVNIIESPHQTRRHLYNKDVDVANDPTTDQASSKKSSYYYSAGYNLLTQKWGAVSGQGPHTERGTSVGSVSSINGIPSYVTVQKYDTGPYTSTSYANLSVINNDWLIDFSLGDKIQDNPTASMQRNMYGTPLLGRQYEFSGSGDGSFILFPHLEHLAPTPSTGSYPFLGGIDAYGNIIHDANPFYFMNSSSGFYNASSSLPLVREDDNAQFGLSQIRSHLPLSSAWNPGSQDTVLAGVDTTKVRNDILDNGRIFITPGFSFGNRTVTQRRAFTPQFSLPSSGGNWPYLGETDARVGVACRPPQTAADYNCIIAWSDRGTPKYNILYTFFRVNDTSPNGNTVEFTPHPLGGSLILRLGANYSAPSGVDAAYFDGKFHLAWKSSHLTTISGYVYSSDHVSFASQLTQTNWAYFTYPRGDVAHPPTFVYDPTNPSNEPGLVWTEMD